MKQWIIIIVSLGLIIGCNFLQSSFLENTSRYVITDINEIKITGARNDKKAIEEAVKALDETWKSIRLGWDVFAEHDLVEEIEESIARIKICVELGEINEMLIENSILKEEIECVVKQEKLRFSNVF